MFGSKNSVRKEKKSDRRNELVFILKSLNPAKTREMPANQLLISTSSVFTESGQTRKIPEGKKWYNVLSNLGAKRLLQKRRKLGPIDSRYFIEIIGLDFF